jgi:Tfp pilus assembly protein PilX
VIVWLWDACGPVRRGRGITSDKARAMQAAEACMRNGHATVATVEAAQFISGIRALTSGYQRIGEGMRGHCGDNGIRWEPFAPTAGLAVS